MKVLLNPTVSNYQNRENLSKKSVVENSTTSTQNFSLPNYKQVDTNLKQYNIRQVSFSGLMDAKVLKEIREALKGNFVEKAQTILKKFFEENANNLSKIKEDSECKLIEEEIDLVHRMQSASANEANKKLLNELEQMILEKKSLLAETADATIQAAKNRIAKFNNWNDTAEYKKAQSTANFFGDEAKKKAVGDHGGIWQFFNTDGSSEYSDAYSQIMNRHYWNEHYEVEEIGKNLSSDKKIVELADANDTQKKARLQQLEQLIEKTKKLISYQGLQDSINEMLSAKGGVSDRIAGYQKEKDAIATKFTQLLAKSKDEPATEVPGCVILHGPLGTGKTTMLNGVVEQSKDYAEIADLTGRLEGGGWRRILEQFLNDAKGAYIKTQKRTIFKLDDAEFILSINKTDASTLGIKLNDADNNILDVYGNNADKIAYFKALLDNVAKVPSEDKNASARSASTFFITTNYPHLIHPDILSREGKATKIYVGLASDFNLGEVLKFHFKKMNDVTDKIKAFKHNPDYKEAIDGLAGITDKGRENIKKMIENGTIDNLHVDYNNMPYEQLAKSLNPSKTEGAYHNDDLKEITRNAFLDYLEKNPAEDDYRDSFFKVLINTKRSINPERYQQFSLIEKMLKDVEINPNDLEQLLKQKKMGMLSEKKANLLQYHVERIKSGLNSLEEQEKNGSLTEAQLKKKKELQELQQKIDASEKSDVKAEEANGDDF